MEGLRSYCMPLLLILAVYVKYSVAGESDLRAHVNTTVSLPCKVERQCGQLHSVKWYKDSKRVYILSHAGEGKPEGHAATERMSVDYLPEKEVALLKISPVKAEDEATYLCEITYLDVIENCDVVQIVKLKTLKKPELVRIVDSNREEISSGTTLGPKEEGTEIDLTCEAVGGKPEPKVRWFNDTVEIKRAEYTVEGEDGNFTGRSVLQLTLSRGDLLRKFECRVESDALEEPIISWIKFDVHVRPTGVSLTGVRDHVVKGTNVLLYCDVPGARPAAKLRWANGTSDITYESLLATKKEDFELKTEVTEAPDSTYTTRGTLAFKASHFENGCTIYCYAENEVMDNVGEPELQSSVILDVRYPPVIWFPAEKFNESTYITVNESTDSSNDVKVLLSCYYHANPQDLKNIYWTKDGRNLTLNDTNKYKGGTIISPHMYVHNVVRDDMGEYICSLENEIGFETSEQSIYVNVQYPPDVEVVMEPSSPVKSLSKSTVLLQCNVTSGNPSTLEKVRWFLDGELMKEVPECNYTSYDEDGNGEGNGGPLCGLDPSILSLERVDESFAGNYTCQGKNLAGWGNKSEPRELIVYYPPSPAILQYYPSKVVKGGSVTLDCKIANPGRPDNLTYIWYRGGHDLPEVTNATLTISPVLLKTRSNFTCIAENEGGKSAPATVFLNVNAPPAFIQRLPYYQGVLYNSRYINLTCIVECYPECSIVWKKDDIILNTGNNSQYRVVTTKLPPDSGKNDFDSINSTLIWNIEKSPGKVLNKSSPHSHYTCQSTANRIGAGVNSTIEIAVDYPPEDVHVSPEIVNVIEHQIPSYVKCYGKGHPTLNFQWKRNSTSDPISTNDELRLGSMRRSDAGGYICEAHNKHGVQQAIAYFNVQYAPECTLSIVQKESYKALRCTVRANPQEVTFTWKVLESNETFAVTSNIHDEELESYLFLDSSVDTVRTYYCSANNSVGTSTACEIDVAGTVVWWNNKMIIIIASIVAIVIVVIIICIIIIILCRRKRADTKSPNPSSVEDKARLGAAPPAGGIADPLSDPDKGFYENLPFHGMQNPPNKPYRPDPCDLEYADVDYKSYGPINYKAASIYAAMKRNKNNNKMEEVNKEDLL